ncbi:arylsulfatase [Sabulilitoribacter arenilitoris]|uniref:Arylsulfatase n=1 Tax=Wocania arenilitoris TaxID=2044858 RepID=A0AAE3JL02_9FLAO|nr:arylsulfatase [Wocania arenilitoris]MCF7567637.1 arylsulfatase [Wocania arenilitoris]
MNTKNYLIKILIIGFVLALSFSCKERAEKNKTQTKPNKPNIIYILADDLGYAEIGAYGQEKIETPNIDALAKNGVLFTQHYTGTPVCAPARFNFLTGKHSGHSYVRGNDEWAERGNVWNYKAAIKDSTLEGQRPIPLKTITVANKLKESGYATAMVGKWGLGAPHTTSIPNNFGFDYFFGFNCQRQAHTYYPVHLYENDKRYPLANDTIAPGTKLAKDANPNDEASYSNYNLKEYASEVMFEKITQFVDTNKDKPFFMYWADPIPHAALQAPKRWVDYYINKFGEEEPYLGDKGYFPTKNPRATYAAMVSYLDENVGKLVAQLKKEGIYENTIIMFTSDNGPTYNGGSDSSWFDSAKPFNSEYGYGKGFLNEGGIRVPMIASWPDKIKAGFKTNLISAHYDVMATFCDIINQKAPTSTDGNSFLPTLLSKPEEQKIHDYLYWEYPEYNGQVAIRMGKWKILWKNIKKGNKEIELYNLEEDLAETRNIASQHPEIVEKLFEIIKKEHSTPEVERFKIDALEEIYNTK